MTELFIRLCNMSISAGWLVLAVLVLRLFLQKAPSWILPVLWGIVGMRLVLPFTVESVFSLLPSAETIAPEIVYAAEPTIHSGVYALNSVVNPVLSESFAPAPGASVNPMQIWLTAGAVLWLIGLAVMLVYAVISWLRLSRKMADAVRLEDNIYETDRCPSPFVLGLIRPKIYLPFALPEPDRTYVIAHEQAHIRRKDHWIKPVGFLLLALHWFNPLIWLAYVLLCRDIELACDERVIRDLDSDARAAYSETLLSCSIPRRSIAACPVAFGESSVKSRVKNVLHYKKPAFWIIIAALVICAVTAVCFLTNPITDSEQRDLTLDDVLRLADKKGEALTWSDFENYNYIETGSGLYIRLYEIDEMFSLAIGGGYPADEAPMYIYLKANTWKDARIDIRYEDPADFIERYRDAAVVRDCSYGWQCSPVGYSVGILTRMNMDAIASSAVDSQVKAVPVQVTDSPAALEKFMDTMADVMDFDRHYGEEPSFRDLLEQYDDAYFRSNTLFLLYIIAPDTACRYEMEYASLENGELELGIARAEYNGGDNMPEGWLMAVGIPTNQLTAMKNVSARVVASYDPEAVMPEVLDTYVACIPDPSDINSFMLPSVTLFEDGTFSFFFSMISSYIGHGTFTMTEDSLVLQTDNNDGFTYVFAVEGDSLIFDYGASDGYLWFSDITDGTVFEKVRTLPEGIVQYSGYGK